MLAELRPAVKIISQDRQKCGHGQPCMHVCLSCEPGLAGPCASV